MAVTFPGPRAGRLSPLAEEFRAGLLLVQSPLGLFLVVCVVWSHLQPRVGVAANVPPGLRPE